MNQQAIQKRDETSLTGTYRHTKQVNQIMERAQQEAILVSPATSVGAMPEGCGIALTKVVVDLSTNDKGDIVSNDTYEVGDKRGLSKTVLQKIGAALGVSWDPALSGRLDDGRNPHYCHWRAVGTYRSFDGQVQTIVGEKEMDLRQGSAQVNALVERYQSQLAKFKAGNPKQRWEPKDPMQGQVREMRLHIVAHAETKAQLRAIRSLGVKSAYTTAELRKPFVCARVMFTGQTDDPQLKRMFAEKTADAFLGGQSALYGRGTGEYAPGRGGAAPLQLTAAPPVGSVPLDDDELIDLGDPGGNEAADQQPAANEQKSASAERKPAARPAAAGPTLPSGDSKGKPLTEASDKDLKYWSSRYERDLADGQSRNPQRDQDMLDAVNSELARRAEVAHQEAGGKY